MTHRDARGGPGRADRPAPFGSRSAGPASFEPLPLLAGFSAAVAHGLSTRGIILTSPSGEVGGGQRAGPGLFVPRGLAHAHGGYLTVPPTRRPRQRFRAAQTFVLVKPAQVATTCPRGLWSCSRCSYDYRVHEGWIIDEQHLATGCIVRAFVCEGCAAAAVPP